MKSVRKPLIISLAVILLLSAANTTAFAVEAANIGEGTFRLVNPVIVSEPAIVPAETAPAQAVQDNDTTDSTVSAGYPAATDAPAAASDETASSIDRAMSSDQSASAAAKATADSETKPVLNITDIIPKATLSAGQKIAIAALKYNGFKYVYGAASPSVGFDCSGFAYYVCKQFGIALPRTAHLQYRTGTAVDKSDLQPGDLVFFSTYGGHSVTHVGVYIGNNQFIHAATTHQGVIISSLDNSYWSKALVGAKRMVSQEVSVSLA